MLTNDSGTASPGNNLQWQLLPPPGDGGQSERQQESSAEKGTWKRPRCEEAKGSVSDYH